jgi:hypothetical protein
MYDSLAVLLIRIKTFLSDPKFPLGSDKKNDAIFSFFSKMFFFVKKIKTEGKKKYIYIRKDVQQIA